MAPWLKPPAAPTEDLGLVPSTHTVAQNHPELQFQEIEVSPLASVSACQTCEGATYVQANRSGNCPPCQLPDVTEHTEQ